MKLWWTRRYEAIREEYEEAGNIDYMMRNMIPTMFAKHNLGWDAFGEHLGNNLDCVREQLWAIREDLAEPPKMKPREARPRE